MLKEPMGNEKMKGWLFLSILSLRPSAEDILGVFLYEVLILGVLTEFWQQCSFILCGKYDSLPKGFSDKNLYYNDKNYA